MKSKRHFQGSLENKYLDLLKKEAQEDERALSSLISLILRKYCREKYGEERNETTR